MAIPLRIQRLLAAAAAFLITAIVGTGGALAGDNGSNGADNDVHDTVAVVYHRCDTGGPEAAATGGDDYLMYAGPTTIWPPDHRYRDWTITAVDGNGEHGPVTLSVTPTWDEPLVGSGNTDNDVVGSWFAQSTGEASVAGRVRAERSGSGDGRTYSFRTRATFDDQSICDHTFTATVPHDEG